ncbi:MAG TPA: AIR synthase-related protein, partial [Longimicrobium sp.]|nr:AIR synthase-related protein [Longimicrobium sp.]
GWIQSAHDTAEGGLAVALAESAIADPAAPFGIEVELDDDIAPHALLFGEAQTRVVISCADGDVDDVLARAAEHGVPAKRIGTVGAPFATFVVRTPGASIEAPVSELAHVYETAIPRRMEGSVADVETSLESAVQHGQE